MLPFTIVRKVKGKVSRVSAKNQVTIPVEALRRAGMEAGARVVIRAEGPGRVVLEREDDPLEEFAGMFTGQYEAETLTRLRDEWD